MKPNSKVPSWLSGLRLAVKTGMSSELCAYSMKVFDWSGRTWEVILSANWKLVMK